jgi:vacuolar-type H+-ATPase subunit H
LAKREILDKIRKTETEVAKDVEKATKDKEALMIAARQKAREIIQKTEEEAEARFKAELEKAKADIQRQLDKIRAEGDKNNAVIKAKAEMKMDKAVDRIIEEFERQINV